MQRRTGSVRRMIAFSALLRLDYRRLRQTTNRKAGRSKSPVTIYQEHPEVEERSVVALQL